MGLRTNVMGTDGCWWAVRACPVPGRRFPSFQGCGGAPRHPRSACEFPNAWSWDANRHNLHTRGREREGGGGSGRGGTEARGPTPLLRTNFLDRLAVGNPRPRSRPRPLPSSSASAGPAPSLEEPASSSRELTSAPAGPAVALAPVGPATALSDCLAAGNPRPRPRPRPLPALAGPAPSLEDPGSSSGELTSAPAGPAAALAPWDLPLLFQTVWQPAILAPALALALCLLLQDLPLPLRNLPHLLGNLPLPLLLPLWDLLLLFWTVW